MHFDLVYVGVIASIALSTVAIFKSGSAKKIVAPVAAKVEADAKAAAAAVAAEAKRVAEAAAAAEKEVKAKAESAAKEIAAKIDALPEAVALKAAQEKFEAAKAAIQKAV